MKAVRTERIFRKILYFTFVDEFLPNNEPKKLYFHPACKVMNASLYFPRVFFRDVDDHFCFFLNRYGIVRN